MATRLLARCALLLAPAIAAAAPLHLPLAPSPPAEVRFRVEAPLDFIPGRSTGVSGWIEVDPGALAAARARVAVDLATFDTGIELRNEDLRDQFFEVARYKEAVLRVDRLENLSAPSATSGADVRADAVGVFALHGVEREVRVPVTLHLEGQGDRITVAVGGAFRVALQDHQIQRPSRLFLKVGEVVDVSFRASFTAVPSRPSGPAVAAEAAPRPVSDQLPRSGAFLPLGRTTRRAADAAPAFRFPFDSPEGRGERLFRDASIGGPGNAVSCASCHAVADERWGLTVDGQVHPNRTLYDSAQRPVLWQGMARSPGKAASICAKWFMLSHGGLGPVREADLAAYLAALSPDPAPALDYRVLAVTRRSGLPNPLGGVARRGRALEKKFCGGCHAEHGLRSPLTPGLYEADDLVRRVRWLPGSDARQMPPIYVDRLTDSDLRDIVTYLVGEPSQRIFQRHRR